MSDRISVLGGFTIAMGAVWLAAGIMGNIIIQDIVAEGSSSDRAVGGIMAAACIWTGVLLLVAYVGGGVGLIMGQNWGRVVTMSVQWFNLFLPLLGWTLLIVTILLLGTDEEESTFGVALPR